MDDCNQNILSVVEKICSKFEDKQLMLSNNQEFVFEINRLFDDMNDNIQKIPDGFEKNHIVICTNMYKENMNMYLSLNDDASFESAKRIADEMKDYLITNLNKCVISIDDYENKLDNYKNSLEKHKDLEKSYKNRIINCDEYIRSYNSLVSLYRNLVYSYNILNNINKDIEKPLELKMVSKDVDNMLLIDMNQKKKEYEEMLDFFEGDIYPNYIDILLKYNNGEISQDIYNNFTLKVLNDEGILNREYNRLQRQFIEYGKMLANGISAYNLATSEELKEFYGKLNKYNILFFEYKKQMAILEGMDKGIISKYNEQVSVIENLYNDVILMEKELKNARGKIYNNSVLTMLNKCKDIIENYLKNTYLLGYDREKYSKDLEKIKTRIEEIKKFKSTMAIKTIKNPTKKTISKKINSKENKGYLNIDRPSSIVIYNDKVVDEVEPIVEHDSIDVNCDNEYILKLKDYNKLLEAYNEQLYLFYQKEKAFLNNDIPYDGEYKQNVAYITMLYKNIKSENESIYDLYVQNRQGIIKDLAFTKDIKLEKLRNLEIPSEPRKPYVSLKKCMQSNDTIGVEKCNKKQITVAFNDLKILGGAMLLKEKTDIYEVISKKISSLNEIDTLNSYEMIKQLYEKISSANISLREKKILNCKLKYRIKYLKYKKPYIDAMKEEEQERKRLSRCL